MTDPSFEAGETNFKNSISLLFWVEFDVMPSELKTQGGSIADVEISRSSLIFISLL